MHRWLYRVVLRLCPPEERDRYSAEMETAFAARIASERARGGRRRAAIAVTRGLLDGAAFAWSVRRERAAAPLISPHVPGNRSPIMRLRDVRETLRLIRYKPLFSSAIIGMLALGLGASTAIFSVVYGVLLKPLPFPDAERIVQIFTTAPHVTSTSLTEANVWAYRDMNGAFEEIGAWHGRSFTLTGAGDPRRVRGARVTAGFFRALGVTPEAGRLLARGEDDSGAPAQRVMLAHAFWREAFGADPTIVGRHITLGGEPHEVIGVLPAGSPWLDAADVFVPLIRRTNANKTSWEYTVIGRIKPGVTAEAAAADLARVATLLAATVPENRGQGVLVRPSSAWIASDTLRSTLWMLLAASGLLLVIGAVNVTNLLLARASSTARESAVRAALGASRMDLLRERITESLMLSLAAVAIGTALAYGMIEVFRSFDPGGIPRLAEVQLNGWALLFASSIAVLVGVATGIVPGLSPVVGLSTALRSGGRGSTADRRHDRLRSVFVAAEVALSLMLLIGAGLLVRSLYQVLTIERGFSAENRLVATVSLPASYGDARLEQTTTAILQALERHPDLISAAAVSGLPLSNGSTGLGVAPGDRITADEDAPWATWRLVSRDYFKTIGLPILAGRVFTEQDIVSKPWRVVISKRLAEQFWPGQDAIGRTIVLWQGQGSSRGEIIGVVGDMRERGLENDPTLAVYFPAYGALDTTTLQLILHTRVDPVAWTNSLREVVRSVDATLPLSNVRPMDDVVAASVATRRFTMLLLVSFAALALLLAVAGVYGVLAYSITRRTQEIGVRLALGAAHGLVLRQAISRGLRPVFAGAVVGALGAYWLSHVMTSLVFQITPRDPVTYAIVFVALLLTALAACYLPARQVMKVQPVTALRAD